MTKSQFKELPLGRINLTGGTQSRVQLSTSTVTEYAEALADGVDLQQPVVFWDGSDYWMADGFHRYHAHAEAKKTKMLCEVRTGTLRDAVLYSVGANSDHGLRRTNADKRYAVSMLLADREWSSRSDNWIAEQCRVSNRVVADIRSKQVGKYQPGNTEPAKRTGRDGKSYPARRAETPESESTATEFTGDTAEEPVEEADEPAPANTEPNTIGEAKEAYDAFVEQLISGKPPHVIQILREHSAEVWAAL